jgi:hypothetical protein
MRTAQKHLVILQGPSQSGKTQSMKHFLSFLHKLDYQLQYKGKKWIECLEVITHQGVTIGVNSRSDKFGVVEKNLAFLSEEMQCDWMFTAINEKTKGINELIEHYRQAGWVCIQLEKFPRYCNRPQKELHLALNLEAAKMVWDTFQQLLAIHHPVQHTSEEDKPFSFLIPSNNNNYGNQ